MEIGRFPGSITMHAFTVRVIPIITTVFLMLHPAMIRLCLASDEGAILNGILKSVAETDFNIFGGKIDGLVRLYGAAGVTFIGRSSTNSPDRISYGGGLQGLYTFGDRYLYFGIGVEASWLFAYRETRSWIEHPRRRPHAYGSGLAVAEFSPVFLTVQIGLGPYIDTVKSGKVLFGMMFAAGFNIPFKKLGAENISAVIMARADLLVDKRIPVPFRFFTGMTFYIPRKKPA